MFVEGTGEVSRGGRVAEGDGRAATVSVGVEAGFAKGLDGRRGTGRHATRGSQWSKRRKLARGARGAGGKRRLVSRERLSPARCGCSHMRTIALNRSIPLGGESEV